MTQNVLLQADVIVWSCTFTVLLHCFIYLLLDGNHGIFKVGHEQMLEHLNVHSFIKHSSVEFLLSNIR